MKKFLINGVLMSALLIMAAGCAQKSEQATANSENTEVATESKEAAATPAKNYAELNTDELLKDYSKLVDEFVELAPKAMSGDTKVTDRFTKLSNELADISSELQKRAKDLTPAQLKEMTDIAQRMASAISK